MALFFFTLAVFNVMLIPCGFATIKKIRVYSSQAHLLIDESQSLLVQLKGLLVIEISEWYNPDRDLDLSIEWDDNRINVIRKVNRVKTNWKQKGF